MPGQSLTSFRDLGTPLSHLSWGPRDVPLGTANWLYFPENARPGFAPGDFFLSRLPSGEPVGLRDDRHVLVCAGTRSGKGVSIIIPNLGLWRGSVVVIDPKGENAIVTARRRAGGTVWSQGLGQKVRILDPFGEVHSPHDDFADLKATFNPLDGLKVDREESVDEAARIADALIVQEGTGDPFWNEAARGLIKAVILHVVSWKGYAPEDRTLIKVRALIMAGDAELRRLIAMNMDDNGKAPSGFALLFDAMSRNKAFDGVVANAGEQFGYMEATAPRVLASVSQVACANTDFLDSPAMRRNLASSSFQLEELKTDRKGVSLYLCLPQRMMGTHYRWLRMMTTLTVTEMERIRYRPNSGHPVLMILDEFAGLQRMKAIENAAAQMAGFGVKMVFVVQTLAQLKDIYKDNWETLVANSGIKLFFGNDDHFSREYASKLIGNTEVVRTTQSRSETRGQSGSMTNGSSFSVSRNAAFNSSTSTNFGGRDGMSFSASGGSSTTFGATHGSTSSVTHGENRSWTDSVQETVHQRPLISPDEIGRLFGKRSDPKALALIAGLQPLSLRRIAYFDDPLCDGCYDPHPDHPLPPTYELQKLLRIRQARERKEQEERDRVEAERLALVRAEAARREKAAWESAIEASIYQYHQSLWEEQECARRGAEERRQWERQEKIDEVVGCLQTGLVGLGCFGVIVFLIWLF